MLIERTHFFQHLLVSLCTGIITINTCSTFRTLCHYEKTHKHLNSFRHVVLHTMQYGESIFIAMLIIVSAQLTVKGCLV